MALFEIDLQMNWDNALSYLLSLSFYCRDLREPISRVPLLSQPYSTFGKPLAETGSQWLED